MDMPMQQKTEEERIQEAEEQKIQHFTELQTWELQPGQTIEQRMEERERAIVEDYVSYNQLLRDYMEKALHPSSAIETAEGAPLQQAKPDGFKEKWAKSSETKKVRKIFGKHPDARQLSAVVDYRTYRGMEELQNRQQARDIVLHNYGDRFDQSNPVRVDGRTVGAFLHDYRVDAKGRPLTRQDSQIQEENDRFVNDYTSNTLERRSPHLNRMVGEIINMQITPQMVTPEYIQSHLAEMKNIADRLVYMDNIQKDPINQPFFRQLSKTDRDVLQLKLGTLTTDLSAMVIAAGNAIGISVNYLGYQTQDDAYRKAIDDINGLEESLQRSTEGMEERIRDLTIQNAESFRQERIRSKAERDAEQRKPMEEATGIRFHAAYRIEDYEMLQKMRQMIDEYPQNYAKNKALVDSIYRDMYQVLDAGGLYVRSKEVLNTDMQHYNVAFRLGRNSTKYIEKYWTNQTMYHQARELALKSYQNKAYNAFKNLLVLNARPRSDGYLKGMQARLEKRDEMTSVT